MTITEIEKQSDELIAQANEIKAQAQQDEQGFQGRMRDAQQKLTALAEALLRLEGRKAQLEETQPEPE